MVLEPGSHEKWTFVMELMSCVKTAFRAEHFYDIEQKLLKRLEDIEKERDEAELAASQKCVPGDEVKQVKAKKKEFEVHLGRAQAELKQLKVENEEVKVKLNQAEVSIGFWKKKFMALEPRVLKLEKDSEIICKELQMSQGEGVVEKETNLDSQVLSAMNAPNSVNHPPLDYTFRGNAETVVGDRGQALKAAGDCLVDISLIKKEIDSDSGMRFGGLAGHQLVEAGSFKNQMNSPKLSCRQPAPGSTMNSPFDAPSVKEDEEDDFFGQQLVHERGRTKKKVGTSKLGSSQCASIDIVEISDSDNDCVDLTAGASERTLVETQTSLDQVRKFENLNSTPLKRKRDFSPALRKPSTFSKQNPLSLKPSTSSMCSPDHLICTSDSSDSEDVMNDARKSGSSTKRSFSRIQMHSGCWSWDSETDMRYAFNKYPLPCMEAVCALYRQYITVDKKIVIDQGSTKLDKLRVSSLAKFLIDGDPHFKLKKSVKELLAYDRQGIDNCRQLALGYSGQLYNIYKNREDPLFPPP